MEPEHEIFFLGWRAHGLRAAECTTVSALHHGWAHRGTPARDRYNAATLRSRKYPDALCKAFPCLKKLSSVHHSIVRPPACPPRAAAAAEPRTPR